MVPECFADELMKQTLMLFLLLTAPAWGQSQPMPIVKPVAKTTARADNCAPIGRTASGELVYSMKCDNIPAPVPPPQARIEETAPPPQSEERRTGLFGWSYDRRQPDQ
jgi:hypothetical protein